MADANDADATPWSTVAAGRLQHVVDVLHPPASGPYSDQEVADGVFTERGVTIAGDQVAALREGAAAMAEHSHVAALAEFFGVPVGYFYDDALASRVDEQLEEARALIKLRALGFEGIRVCAGARTPSKLSYRAMLAMVENAHEVTGL